MGDRTWRDISSPTWRLFCNASWSGTSISQYPPEVPRFLYFGIDISHPQSHFIRSIQILGSLQMPDGQIKLFYNTSWKTHHQRSFSNSPSSGMGHSQFDRLFNRASNTFDQFIPRIETSSESFIHPTVIKIMQRIADQPGINWNLEALSIEYKLNSKYLSNLFKRESGRGFQKFIMNQRIQRAYQLLRKQKIDH